MAPISASIPASPLLCPTCRSIFQHTFTQSIPHPKNWVGNSSSTLTDPALQTVDPPSPHHVSAADLRASALQNCYFCSVLLRKIPSEVDVDLTSGFTSYYIRNDACSETDAGYKEDRATIKNYLRLTFMLGGKASSRFGNVLEEYILFRSHELEKYISQKTLTNTTASTGSWETALGWIEKCKSSHEKCRHGVGFEQKRKLPTRLLEISKDQAVVTLRDTVDFPTTTEYTTLSHCWGKAQIFTLVDKTKDDLRNGLQTSRLNKTFQEAITVSQRLGFNYIWIDSMCIIQDSRKDWESESAMMGDVYRNSALNIAATGSSDGSGGLFHSRDPISFLPYSLQTSWSIESATNIPDLSGIDINDNYTIYPKDFWHSALSTAPLLTRGWVLQERVLCPRMLHFSTTQLLWECLEHDASEVYPGGRPDKYITKNTLSQTDAYKPVKPLTDVGAVERATDVVNQKFVRWKLIVTMASTLALTKSSDKLAALSGVAKSMRVPSDDEYLAGLWKSEIFGFLFWFVPDGRQANGARSQRIKPYVAPSWSWASLDAVIDYRVMSLYAIFLKIVETKIVLATPDPTGQVKPGCFLRLTGPVLPLRIPDPVRVSSDLDGMTMAAMRDLDMTAFWGYLDQEPGQPIFLADELLHASLKPDFPFDSGPDARLWFLATEFDWSWRMSGMIIREVGDGGGSFERVGYAAINNDESKAKWTIEYEDAWPLLEPFVREIVLV